MLKKLKYIFVLLIIAVLSSCKQNSNDTMENMLPTNITVSGSSFVDQYGRQVILTGVNLVNKNPDVNYIGTEDSTTFSNLKKWGFNVIRLGIIWDGLEPEPGKYDETYLSKIDQQVKWAADAGLFVYLDMHQDLFSVKYSDGAPEWATLDEDKPHYTGDVWSDSYLISPAVQTAWDNFWKNTSITSGMGVQDYYANAWMHIAKRYKGNKTVIGYDMMNEPFAGSDAQMYMPILFTAYAQLYETETGNKISAEEVAMKWSTTDGRYEALKLLNDKEKFAAVVTSVYDLNAAFEKNTLQTFYQKVADSIRTIDMEKVLFFNHSYFCNSGVPTALEPMKLADGQRDSLVAYAAHGYDLLVDTKNLENSSSGRLELIFESINNSAARMHVPVIIGEWGALGADSEGMKNLAARNIDFINEYKFSDTYWAYDPGIENYAYFKEMLVHPYPYAVSGKIKMFSYSETTGEFVCEWTENKELEKPTLFYVPDLQKANLETITETYHIAPIKNSGAGYLVFPSKGKEGKRAVRFIYRY